MAVHPSPGGRRFGFLPLDAHWRAPCAAAYPDPTRFERAAGTSAPGAAVESYEAAGGSRVGFCWPCGSKFKMRANSGARNVMVGSSLRLYLVRRRSAGGLPGVRRALRPAVGHVRLESGRGPGTSSGVRRRVRPRPAEVRHQGLADQQHQPGVRHGPTGRPSQVWPDPSRSGNPGPADLPRSC